MKYQGFFKRLLAYLIDGIILGAVLALVAFIWGSNVESRDSIIDTMTPFLSLAYFIILPITVLQGTLGKYVLGMKIINSQGERISLLQSIVRFFSSFLSSLIFFIGYFMIAFTKNKQALHDKISKTYVIAK